MNNLLNYRPACLHTGKRTYISYYFREIFETNLKRYRVYVDHIHPKNRKKYAEELVREINKYLIAGKNPKVKNAEIIEGLNIFNAFTKVKDIRCKSSEKRRTISSYENKAKFFLQWLIEADLDKIPASLFNKKHAQAYMDWITETREVCGRTYNNYLSDTGAFFNDMVEREMIAANPFTSIKKRKETDKIREPFTPDQLTQYSDHVKEFDPHFYIISCYCFYTTLRPSEIVQLKVKHINLKDRQILVPGKESKNNRQQAIPMFDQLYEILLEYGIDKYDREMLICGKGFKPGYISIYSTRIAERFRMYADLLRLPDEIKFYSLKDTMAIELIKEGHDIRFIQFFLRHSNISTTEKYISKYRPVINVDNRKKIPEF